MSRQARIDLNPELTEIVLSPQEWTLTLQPQIVSVEYEVDKILLQLGGAQPAINTPFTTENAQDAIGSILVDSSTINFTYDDSTPSITAVVTLSAADIPNLDASKITTGAFADSLIPSGIARDTEVQAVVAIHESTRNHPDATNSLPGLMTAANKVKLDGIAAGATANSTDAYLLSRANHTGTQAISTVTGLQTALDGKQAVLGYTPADVLAVPGLARSAITLTTLGNSGIASYSSSTGVLNIPNYSLTGLGGISLSSLSASSPLAYDNGTGAFSIQQASGSQPGYLSSTDWTTFNGKQAALGYTPLNPASNLSDVASTSTARTNLGLGSLATVTPTGTPDGTKFLRDDGSWQTVSGGSGTPGGLTTQVQYNNAGAFAGSANLTFDGTVLSANGLSVTNTIHRLKSVPNIGYRERTTPTATTTRISIYADGTKAVEWYRTVLTVDSNGDLTTKVETDYTRSPNVTRTTTYSRDVYGDLANWEVA